MLDYVLLASAVILRPIFKSELHLSMKIFEPLTVKCNKVYVEESLLLSNRNLE